MVRDINPRHQFVVSNDAEVVIRFCVRCGLSNLLDSIALHDLGVQVQYPLMTPTSVPCWRHINEDERDMTVSDLCPVEQDSDDLKRRYLWVPKS